jgi:hypothetical protein
MSINSKEKRKLYEDAEKKKRKRALNAEIEGRVVGKNGRPCIADKDVNDIICGMILKDANDGVFHDVNWVIEMVCVFHLIIFIIIVACYNKES